jgi:flavin reductase (DIM6/NTAB) family NADH-FMN oxidoreductase RutF
VSVLSTRLGAQTHGMTVNSFSSVSLEPPLVLACLEHLVRTHEMVKESGVFALSFLHSGQAWISDRFAGRETENTDRFAGLPTYTALTGAPILADNLGYLDCEVRAAHPAGNHTIFVAEVVAAGLGSVERVETQPNGSGPLLYFNRAYRELC